MRFLSWIFVFYCFALTMLKGVECSTGRPPLWTTWSSGQPSFSGHQQTRNRAETCNTTNCVWSWGPCSKLCGGGTRNATLIEPEGNCGSCDMPWEAGSCNTSPCPPPRFSPMASASSTNCSCGEWQAWSHCIASSCSSKTGVQIRNHANFLTCFKPECRTASTQNCTNPCTWTPWGEFTPCSQTCGLSTRIRIRTVTPSFCNLLRCNGSIEEENCTVPACTCDPEPWGPWGWCTTPCGPGTRTRRRIHSPCSAEPTVMSGDCGNVPCYNSSTIIFVTPTENISIPINTTVPCSGGNYTANSSRQYLTSPGYPGNYPNLETCIWDIHARSGYLILLQIEQFRTESCCDRLTITGLQTPVVVLVGRITRTRWYFSQSNIVRLRFSSDGSVTNTGFQLWFQESRTNTYPTTAAVPTTTQGTPLAVTGPNSSSRIYSTFVPLILAFATLFGTSSIAE